jgi:hypothetical protein
MTDDRNLSALFSAIVEWALQVKGAEDVGSGGTIWIEQTEPNEHFSAAVKVEMNATTAEIDDIPPFHARLTNEVYFPGIMGLVNPYGGTLVGAGPGDEDRLIEHFNSQPRPQSEAA